MHYMYDACLIKAYDIEKEIMNMPVMFYMREEKQV
jgi:hypothetical protein